jgi:hypothetical protein
MTQMVYKEGIVNVLEVGGSQTRISPVNGDEWDAFWVPSVKLSPLSTPKLSWEQRLAANVSSLPEVANDLLNEDVAQSAEVRIICPARLEGFARQMFDREGVSYPENWRGTEFGKRGGTEEQRGISATVSIPRGVLSNGLMLALEATGAKIKDNFVVFNNFEYTMKLLVDGRAYGWRITKSV